MLNPSLTCMLSDCYFLHLFTGITEENITIHRCGSRERHDLCLFKGRTTTIKHCAVYLTFRIFISKIYLHATVKFHTCVFFYNK